MAFPDKRGRGGPADGPGSDDDVTCHDDSLSWARAKHRATETARYVVDQAMRSAGGGGYRTASELSRLQRDVLAGIYHPSDTESVHSTVAANLLGPLA